MHYKIGVLAKQFGISPQSLRFYEKEGLMPAHTQPDSSTRQYSARNIKWLFSIRRYLAQGFSTGEIKRLYLCDSPGEIERRLSVKEENIRREIARLSLLADHIAHDRTRINGMDELLYRCRIEQNPELLLIMNQHGQQVDNSPEMLAAIERWMAFLPYVDSASVIDRGALNYRTDVRPRHSGFIIEADIAQRIGLKGEPPALAIAPTQCLHTITTLAGTDRDGLDHCIEYMNEHGLEASGDCFGRCLVKVREENCKTTLCPSAIYYEYWLPIASREK